MMCSRPGCANPEDRIKGYCSVYCKDIHHEETETADALSQAAAWQARAERLKGALREIDRALYTSGVGCELCSAWNGKSIWGEKVSDPEDHKNSCPLRILSSPRPSPSRLLEVARAAIQLMMSPSDGEVHGRTDRLDRAVATLSDAEREAIMGTDKGGCDE